MTHFELSNINLDKKAAADSIFTAPNVNFAASAPKIKLPEIKDGFERKSVEKKIDATNDNKFSFLEFGKNVAKGAGKFFVDIYKNIVEKPLTTLPMMFVGAAMASTPLGLMILAGGGIAAGLFGLAFAGIKSAKLINNEKWDELEKAGKDFGKLIPELALSSLAAIKGAKMLSKASGIKNSATGLWTSAKKALKVDLELTGRVFWSAIKAPFRAIKKHAFKKELKDSQKVFSLKDNYAAFSDNLKNSKIFKPAEQEYLASLLDKSNPNPKLFDWKLQEWKGTLPAIFKQAAD